ncbi:MAG: recombinase family protein [Candidatus Caenarcaniphilales bacterium]|nr:recombinase family protein [Candidatus Caenarcaniphilales bacterium]
MNKYAIYYRVSTEGQGKSGLGLDAQKSLCENFIRQQNGEVIKEVVEIETGTSKIRISHEKPFSLESLLKKRPMLKEIINFCHKEKATLVTADLSRLGRSQLLISYLMQTGINFVCADSPNDGPFILQIKAAVFEEEARTISKRTKVALAAKKAKGFKLGNPRFQDVDRTHRAKVEIKEAQKAYGQVSVLIKKLRCEGKSFRMIATELNQLGFKTRFGGEFHGMTVRRILGRI